MCSFLPSVRAEALSRRPRPGSSATSGGLSLNPFTNPSQRSPDPLPVEHIQSLSDLAQSYSVVREMGVVPFGATGHHPARDHHRRPLLPLGLTVFSVEELVLRLVKILL
jgi:hypothetical protein